MSSFRVLAILAATSLLASCSEIGCSGLDARVSDPASAAELVEWADEAIFLKGISADLVVSGGLVGPGRRKLRADEGFSEAAPLAYLEIRLIGDSPTEPSAIFIASGAYKGIIVSREREGLRQALKDEGVVQNEILRIAPRLAAICRPMR